MAEYRLPTWNLLVNIWLPGNPTTNPADYTSVPCQMRFPKLEVPQGLVAPNSTALNFGAVGIWLLLPAGTDVRRPTATPTSPSWLQMTRILIEARLYGVLSFEDRAAGFPNEHRCCWALRLAPDAAPLPPIFEE